MSYTPATPEELAYRRGLGKRLRASREASGRSLAKVEAVSRGEFKAVVVASYERGDRAVRADWLVRYAAWLDVSAAWLLTGERIADAVAAKAERARILDLIGAP